MTGFWRNPRLPWLVGAAALLICAIAWVADPTDMARGWLTVALLLLGLPLGALMLLMVDNLTGGRWGEAIRPLLLALAGTLPLALLLFLPLLFDILAVFPWAGAPETLSLMAQRKLAYLNPPGLVLRFFLCGGAWLALAFILGVWNGAQAPPWRSRPLISGLGLALHALVFTVFATDWMISIEPDFYSTIYPMLVAVEEIVLALSAILLVPGLARRPGGAPGATLGEDLAKLLVSAVLGWAYLAFMQWIVIWSGDLPEEIGWYLVRLNQGWQWVLWAIVLFAFAVPFVGLISSRGKRDPRWLGMIVLTTLVGQVLEGVWRIAPAYPASPTMLLLLLPAAVGMGGIGLIVAIIQLGRTNIPAGGGVHGQAG